MTYDNIKRHKKPVLHPLSKRYIFGKTAEAGSIWLKLLMLSYTIKGFLGCLLLKLRKFFISNNSKHVLKPMLSCPDVFLGDMCVCLENHW